jgi:hypothetical protein
MTIQDALNTAVAGGYHVQGSDGVVTVYSGASSDFTLWTRTDNASSFMIPLEETLLDLAFWRAFGRALAKERISPSGDWKQLWHQCIEHLIHGGTPAGFFQTLASPLVPQEREGAEAWAPAGCRGRTASPGGRSMRTFLVMIEFEYTAVDAQGHPYVRTGSTEVREQATSPLAAEDQARAAFAASARGAIITVSVRAHHPPS